VIILHDGTVVNQAVGTTTGLTQLVGTTTVVGTETNDDYLTGETLVDGIGAITTVGT